MVWFCTKEWFVVSPEPAKESKKYGDRRNEHSDALRASKWRSARDMYETGKLLQFALVGGPRNAGSRWRILFVPISSPKMEIRSKHQAGKGRAAVLDDVSCRVTAPTPGTCSSAPPIWTYSNEAWRGGTRLAFLIESSVTATTDVHRHVKNQAWGCTTIILGQIAQQYKANSNHPPNREVNKKQLISQRKRRSKWQGTY